MFLTKVRVNIWGGRHGGLVPGQQAALLSAQRTQVLVGPPQGENPSKMGRSLWFGLGSTPCPPQGSCPLPNLSFPSNKRSLPWAVLSVCRALYSSPRISCSGSHGPYLPSKHCGSTGATAGAKPNTWPDICLLSWPDRSIRSGLALGRKAPFILSGNPPRPR